jgi:hypothetical protein
LILNAPNCRWMYGAATTPPTHAKTSAHTSASVMTDPSKTDLSFIVPSLFAYGVSQAEYQTA